MSVDRLSASAKKSAQLSQGGGCSFGKGRAWGPAALSLQKERHRICSQIWCEVDERWGKATMRPSPGRTDRMLDCCSAVPPRTPIEAVMAPEAGAYAILVSMTSPAVTARGRKPPLWAGKRPARPYKRVTQNRSTAGNATGA